MAGIPCLYFAEIDAVELDTNRKIKAPRYLNSVIPFSSLSVTQRQNAFATRFINSIRQSLKAHAIRLPFIFYQRNFLVRQAIQFVHQCVDLAF